MQKTRLFFIYGRLNTLFFGFFRSNWKTKSLNVISILIGYFLFTNLVSNYLSKFNNKFLVVPLLILFFEVIIRLQPSRRNKFYDLWSIFDKLRVGGIYALILEAFKLGS